MRYFGSNGFLGYIGIMGSTPYGKYYSYVKNPQQQVFVLTQNKNYLLSCENRDIFIKELSNKLLSNLWISNWENRILSSKANEIFL